MIRNRHTIAALLCMAFVATACALRLPGLPSTRVEPLRISEIVDVGDPARRASLRIIVNGLEADASNLTQRALGTYEEALRVDPTNPWAYLAIARHHAEADDPEWALSFLDKADALFRAEGPLSPRVESHLIGLRGQALYASGEVDLGASYLERAWDMAPDVWTDGRLSAAELR